MSGWNTWEERKQEYHPNFARRSRWRKKRVKYTCEKCGIKQGETKLSKSGHPYRVVVSAAHVNHDPANPRAKLIILCQTCHLEHDVFEHARKTKQTYHRKQRDKKLESGQLELPLKFKKEPKKRCNTP